MPYYGIIFITGQWLQKSNKHYFKWYMTTWLSCCLNLVKTLSTTCCWTGLCHTDTWTWVSMFPDDDCISASRVPLGIHTCYCNHVRTKYTAHSTAWATLVMSYHATAAQWFYDKSSSEISSRTQFAKCAFYTADDGFDNPGLFTQDLFPVHATKRPDPFQLPLLVTVTRRKPYNIEYTNPWTTKDFIWNHISKNTRWFQCVTIDQKMTSDKKNTQSDMKRAYGCNQTRTVDSRSQSATVMWCDYTVTLPLH